MLKMVKDQVINARRQNLCIQANNEIVCLHTTSPTKFHAASNTKVEIC